MAQARRDREAALAELRQVSAEREAALEGQLAVVEETYEERLARAEEQKSVASRRLAKAAKSKQGIISQLEAEKSMLEQRADALENELCEALDASRRQTEQVSKLTRRVAELEEALEAAAGGGGGAHGAHAGRRFSELRQQLTVSTSVKDALRTDIVGLERDLVDAKLACAQAEEDKAALRRQLKGSRARQLLLSERMTELEVRLAQAFDEAAVAEERIASAFTGVIRELESQLRGDAAARPPEPPGRTEA